MLLFFLHLLRLFVHKDNEAFFLNFGCIHFHIWIRVSLVSNLVINIIIQLLLKLLCNNNNSIVIR